jgi:hypothetical protein
MTEILSLAFPGFIAVTVFRWFGRSRSRTGWDYLILTGIAGGGSYISAWILAVYLSNIHELDVIREAVDQLFPGRPDNGTYALSFLTAILLGWISAKLLYCDSLRRSYGLLGMRHPPGETDALSQLQVDAEKFPFVVSTTLGQVYIGQIQKVTTDPDEDTKVLVLRIFAAGSRLEETVNNKKFRKVKYNYVIDHKLGVSRLTYLDFKGVVSISQFGLPEFEQTRDSGYSEISEEDFETLLSDLTASFRGFADEAERFYSNEVDRLNYALSKQRREP